jgi:hypothetical protein
MEAATQNAVVALPLALGYGAIAPPGAPDLPGLADDAGRGAGRMSRWFGNILSKALRTSGGQKPVSLPTWSKVVVDIAHILERHTHGGPYSSGRSLFPVTMNEASITRAIRTAYNTARKVGVQGDRIQLLGTGAGLRIEMWFNRVTNTIETAYPKP